jgi:hypothetical protein
LNSFKKIPFYSLPSPCNSAGNLRQKLFFGKFFAKRRCLPLGNFYFFLLQHPEIFIVYVAYPGEDADKFLLPLNQNFFWQALLQKNLTQQFFMKKL